MPILILLLVALKIVSPIRPILLLFIVFDSTYGSRGTVVLLFIVPS